METRAFLLDVDGVLVDSNYHHVLAWQHALARLGVDIPSVVLHAHVGMGGDHYVAAVTSDAWDAAHGDEARSAHAEHYARLADDVHALPGAARLVEELLAREIAVVLASSATQQEIAAHVERIGVDADRYAGVVTRSEVGATKPSPDVFRSALDRTGVEADEAVVVGDTRWDVLAAQRLGVPTIGLESGGRSAAELLDAGAVTVFADASALAAELDRACGQVSQARHRVR